MSMEYFGDKLRALRVDKKMTQEEVAKRTGLVRGTISAYETNAKYPSVEILIKLCNIFEVSADYLLGLSDVKDFQFADLSNRQLQAVTEIVNDLEQLNALRGEE